MVEKVILYREWDCEQYQFNTLVDSYSLGSQTDKTDHSTNLRNTTGLQKKLTPKNKRKSHRGVGKRSTCSFKKRKKNTLSSHC